MNINIKKAQKSSAYNCKRMIAEAPLFLIQEEAEFFKKFSRSFSLPIFGLQNLYDFMDKLNAHVNKYTTCKKGCDACCYIHIDISALEAEYIEIKTGIPRLEKANSFFEKGKPCPFLKDHCCSIYQYRPYVCRQHIAFFDANLYPVSSCNDIFATMSRFSEVEKSHRYLIMISKSEIHDIRAFFNS